jgi:hypothetical protein
VYLYSFRLYFARQHTDTDYFYFSTARAHTLSQCVLFSPLACLGMGVMGAFSFSRAGAVAMHLFVCICVCCSLLLRAFSFFSRLQLQLHPRRDRGRKCIGGRVAFHWHFGAVGWLIAFALVGVELF